MGRNNPSLIKVSEKYLPGSCVSVGGGQRTKSGHLAVTEDVDAASLSPSQRTQI
ncbi:hypothetical protein PVAP13_6KG182600 [Panicum virgatum]|uniref:Uncharacterized protein n=1 Tax=Panicum virgatum TaxID=38727 RepID=A0A8T0RC89_PANVG|nr:hypothetical protein PVAP13_6KG182600 [Panicum virgatum]